MSFRGESAKRPFRVCMCGCLEASLVVAITAAEGRHPGRYIILVPTAAIASHPGRQTFFFYSRLSLSGCLIRSIGRNAVQGGVWSMIGHFENTYLTGHVLFKSDRRLTLPAYSTCMYLGSPISEIGGIPKPHHHRQHELSPRNRQYML